MDNMKFLQGSSLKELLLDFVFPQNLNCIICDMPISRKNRYSMCRFCYEKLYLINHPCSKCGKPIINRSLDMKNNIVDCGYCSNKNFLFERNISVLEYDDISSKMVFLLKYGLKTYMAEYIGRLMSDFLFEKYRYILDEYEIITFVPLSGKRYKKRGFNQAEKIAKTMSKNIDIPVFDILDRIKDTRRLHGLNFDERRRELVGKFCMKYKYISEIKGKNIAVVDDIFTTGSTLNEVSKVLILNGANKVLGLTFATGKYINPIDI